MEWLGNLTTQICIESNSNVNLCLVFYLKVFLLFTQPFKKEADVSGVSFLFVGNNLSHITVLPNWFLESEKFWVLLKFIWLWWLLSSWCPSCRLVIWPGFPFQLDTIFLCRSLQQVETRNRLSMLSWAIVSGQLVGKGQVLTHIKSCRCVGCQAIALSRTEEIVSPNVCMVLSLYSLNYYLR